MDNVIAALKRWSAQRPDEEAFSFIDEKETRADSLTWRTLEQRAAALASVLPSKYPRGSRALMLYPSGLSFVVAFFGVLGAGWVAVPAPFRGSRGVGRLSLIIEDSSPSVVLTESRSALAVQRALRESGLEYLPVIVTDEVTRGLPSNLSLTAPRGEELAVLQYTSGSTSHPKGVMLRHQDIFHNLDWSQRSWGVKPHERIVSWLPHFHDLGLGVGLLIPAISGAHCTLISPLTIISKPNRWLSVMSEEKATISGGPNFIFDLCARRVTDEDRKKLDLSNWSVSVVAAEPVRLETLQRFSDVFASTGFSLKTFVPAYGLAESTCKVVSSRRGDGPKFVHVNKAALAKNRVEILPSSTSETTSLVAGGLIEPEADIAIVDANSYCRLGDAQVGEIWVRAPGVSPGYFNRPDEAAFSGYLSDDGSGPYLRTGDLGFIHQGFLYITGRIKDLIIINGVNHYPQDIELTIEQCHSSIRPGGSAAFAIHGDEGEQLVVAVEVERRLRVRDTQASDTPAWEAKSEVHLDEVRQLIAKRIWTNHQVPVREVVLLAPGKLPKTTSGKVQRHACREEYLGARLNLDLGDDRNASS